MPDTRRPFYGLRGAASFCAALALSLGLITAAHAQAKSAPVTLAEDDSAYTLSNGIVIVRVDKKSGDLLSLKYKDMEMLGTVARPGTAFPTP